MPQFLTVCSIFEKNSRKVHDICLTISALRPLNYPIRRVILQNPAGLIATKRFLIDSYILKHELSGYQLLPQVFSRVHATLYPTVSVRRLVGWSVTHLLVFLAFFGQFLHHCPCPIARDYFWPYYMYGL